MRRGLRGFAIDAGLPPAATDAVAAAIGSIVSEEGATGPATAIEAAVLNDVAASLELVGTRGSGIIRKVSPG